MYSEKSKTCCFVGHRKVKNYNATKDKVKVIVENLITKEGVSVFLLGSKSEFNTLCYEVITELKKVHKHIERIYVRAEFPYIDDEYKNYLLEYYEQTYYPEKIIKSGRACYVERNYEMIENSAYCIVCFDEAHTQQKGDTGNKGNIKAKSGTKLACEFAKRKKRNVFNVFIDDI